MIAALYVQKNGAYFGDANVDPWDETRDARLYAGPHAVVAHPPCARWCALAALVEKWIGFKQGDDAGCFDAALRVVRTFGGVLEHPANSRAFAAHGLPAPKKGGWQPTPCGGWVCHVAQWHYGHAAAKGTWLYVHGVAQRDLPALNFEPPGKTAARVGPRDGCSKRSLKDAEASRTPPAFKAILLDIAKSAEAAQRFKKRARPQQE